MVQARPVVDQVACPTAMSPLQPIRGQYPGIDQSEARIISGPEAWPPAEQVMEHWPPETPGVITDQSEALVGEHQPIRSQCSAPLTP